MHDRILARELGSLSPHDFAKAVTTDLANDFILAQHHRFDGTTGAAGGGTASGMEQPHETSIVAHRGGCNTLTIEKFDGKL